MEPKLIAERQWSPDIHWKMYVGHPVPPRELCATAYCLAFKDGKMALTRHHRGWDIPGGHVEPGETMEDAARRETFEETGMTVSDPRLIAVQRVDQKVQTSRNGRQYPFPTCYGLWYAAPIVDIGAIPAGFESAEAKLFTPDEIRAKQFDFLPCFEEALRVAQAERFFL